MTKKDTLKLGAFLPYRLSVASNAVSEVIGGAYRALFGLTVPEWRLITVIAEHSTATQFQLAAATRMDKLTVSRAAIALVDRGLVVRAANPADKRSHLLSLSASGDQLYRQVAPKALALEKQLLRGFSADERSALMAMLCKLEDAASRMARV